MSIAIPKEVAAGKTDPSTIYARITNKNVYRLNGNCDPAKVPSLIADIKAAGKIHLKNWTKVEKRAITPGIPDDEKGMTDADLRAASLSSPLDHYHLAMRKPLMGADPVAPRFRILDQFKAKCDALDNKGNHWALQDLYDAKARKASKYKAALAAFDKQGVVNEEWFEERDRIQRVLDVVEAERDYAISLMPCQDDDADSAWEANS